MLRIYLIKSRKVVAYYFNNLKSKSGYIIEQPQMVPYVFKTIIKFEIHTKGYKKKTKKLTSEDKKNL